MSAKFDIMLFTTSIVEIEYIFKIVKKNRLTIQINKIEILDDWKYSNYIFYDLPVDLDIIRENINKNKIVIADIIINSKYRCGYSSYKVSENIIETNLWTDTSYFESLDSDFINSQNQCIYDTMTNIIINNIKETNLKLAAIGAEITIKYTNDIEKMMNVNYGVNRWIIPYGKINIGGSKSINKGNIQIIDKVK